MKLPPASILVSIIFFLRPCSQVKHTVSSWLQKISSSTIRTKCKQNNQLSVLDIIQRRQQQWCGHLLRMNDSRWAMEIYQWTSHDSKRRERPQQSWKNQVMDFMRSRNIEKGMVQHRLLWRLGMDRRLFALWILIIDYMCVCVCACACVCVCVCMLYLHQIFLLCYFLMVDTV